MMTLPSGSTRRCAGSAATAKSVIPQARDFVLVDVIAEGLLTTHNDERCLHSGQHGSFRLMLCAVDRRRDVPSVTEGTGVGRWWPCSHCCLEGCLHTERFGKKPILGEAHSKIGI